MNPLLLKGLAAVGAGLGGLEVYKHFYPKLQVLTHIGPSGHAIKVAVPVIPNPPIRSVAVAPLPPNNGNVARFIPPPPSSMAVANEPTVITPNGAANLSVDNIRDIQSALNALGQQPTLATDNINGPLTQSAIRSFQASHGLPVDGRPSQSLQTAVQSALSRVAATQSHIGQSIPVQAAAPAPHTNPAEQVAGIALQVANSPAGKSLINTGLNAIASAFSGGNSDTNADTTTTKPSKDAVIALQRALNLLGASPPLDENGDFNPETVAAVKAVQIAFGLVADGVPAAKTATAMAVALDPAAQIQVVPSLPKAADHIASVAAIVPPPVAAPLTQAAGDLKVATVATPVPSDSQTHASTAAAQAATAASAAPNIAVAVPLAQASSSLAAAATTGTPDPINLTKAAAAISTAVAADSAAGGSTSTPSLAAAADHITAAANAPDEATKGDHLNSAAQHLSNAAVGTPPTATATVNGEFGGFLSFLTKGINSIGGWWHHKKNNFFAWHRHMHPAYRPALSQNPYMIRHFAPQGDFGYGGRSGYRRHHRDWERQERMQQQQQQGGNGGDGGGDDSSDVGFGWGGGWNRGGANGGWSREYRQRSDWNRRRWQERQEMQQQLQQSGMPYDENLFDPDALDAGFGIGVIIPSQYPHYDDSADAGFGVAGLTGYGYGGAGFGVNAPVGYRGGTAAANAMAAQINANLAAGRSASGGAPIPLARPGTPTGQMVNGQFVPAQGGGQINQGNQPFGNRNNWTPQGYGLPQPGHPDSSAYWRHRRESLGDGDRFDRNWFDRDGYRPWQGQGQIMPEFIPVPVPIPDPSQGYDPNAINAYQDPNAANPYVQNPELDAQVANGGGGDDTNNGN